MADLSQIAELITKHLPPSADRVRVRPLDEPGRVWAAALGVECLVMNEAAECDATLAADLGLLPHLTLRPGGRAIFLLSNETRPLSDLATVLAAAGLIRILTEPVLDGACVLARGEQPSMDSAATWRVPDRNAVLAALGMDVTVIPAGQPLPRYLHLLVHQEPPSRGWEPSDPGPVTWDAVTIRRKATDEPVLLGFSSLVKAVAFMKPAVLAGAMPGVNMLPRYRGETAAGWGIALLVNPAFEALRDDSRYEFGSPPLRVDPRLEDKVRE